MSTSGGSLALITFNVIGTPTGVTSVVNISGSNPAATELDVAASGGSVALPFAIAPVDNTSFNGAPGTTDGIIRFPANTTTTVSATVGGSSVATVTYGTLVTLTATVAASAGTLAPSLGSVDFKDGAIDLGVVSTDTTSGTNSIFTLVTTPNQLQVLLSGGGVHTITAAYTAGLDFNNSSGTLGGGLQVTPASLTIKAVTNSRSYDSTTNASALPTTIGLVGTDTITGQAEAYTDRNVGTSKTLSVTAYTVNDTNGGHDYTVTTVTNTTGIITKAALTITAVTNVKTYDANASALGVPTVAGLFGADTATGLAEVYTNVNAGSSKTLSVSAFTVNDSNGGNNYAVTTATNTTGVINKAALTITASANTKAYDSTTTAAATPAVAGLKGSDTVSTSAEVYLTASAGTGKTLSFATYAVNDGNGGNNYAVSVVNTNTNGVINKAALTITATTNTKTYDSTVSAALHPPFRVCKGPTRPPDLSRFMRPPAPAPARR